MPPKAQCLGNIGNTQRGRIERQHAQAMPQGVLLCSTTLAHYGQQLAHCPGEDAQCARQAARSWSVGGPAVLAE